LANAFVAPVARIECTQTPTASAAMLVAFAYFMTIVAIDGARIEVLTAAELKDEFEQQRQHRSAPERMFRLAFLQRLFSNPQTLVLPSSGTPTEVPKSFWSGWSLSAFVPIAGAILIAFAAWRTGETSSWKGVADANKAHVETLKDQLVQAQNDKKDLQQKNDALQNDLNDTLRNAADQKSDVATLTQKLGELLKKYKNGVPPTATATPPAAQ
jgi:hypothetical protein